VRLRSSQSHGGKREKEGKNGTRRQIRNAVEDGLTA
jgi:hypothetical protein